MSSSAADGPGSAGTGSGRAWVVPGFTEVRPLGGGGFGAVVLATHDASGTAVAIKYLHPGLLDDAGQAALFRAEAATLAGLVSPYVVRLYEYVEGPAGAAIVMELVEGVTLAAILEAEGRTTPEAALVVLFGSLLGLAAAHARGVVHRDYKPANVLVDGRGASKLTDFGIAALAGSRAAPAGTLRYMPPEQFEGAPASPAADVYAATVTFYQCLAGQVPFDGATAAELYDLHRSAPVPMGPVPGPLRPVVARGLAKDPRWRPSDAVLLAGQLAEAAAGAYGPDWQERGRSQLAGAALLLLALLWPSAAAPAAVQGAVVEHVRLGAGSGQDGGARDPRHAENARHAGQGRVTRAGQHQWHLRHILHLEHLAHLRYLRRLRGEDGAEAGTGPREPKSAPRRRPSGRVLRIAAAATAAVAAVSIVAVALTSHTSHPSPGGPAGGATPSAGATGATTQPGGGGPAAVANETAAKVEVVATGSPVTAGPLLGPDGRLWDETVDTTGTIATLVATNATTFATTTYKLPATLNGDSVIYSGAAAFDGAGHLWLTAYLRDDSTGTTTAVLLQYTPGGGAIQQVAEDSECATGGSDAAEVYEANDGAVWVACPANGDGGGYDYYRMTPGGGITTMTIDNNAQPGTLLYLAYEELPEEGTGPLVQGPAGSMYGLSSTDIVEFTASGQETLAIDDAKDDPIQLVGNGTGLLEAVAVCDVNTAQGEQSEQCINKVNADGSETLIADLPNYDGYNTELVHWAVMDSSGNVWMILDTTGPAPVKQYYVEVSPGGATKIFPFTVPGDSGTVPVAQAPPVITPDGGLWTADAASQYPGALVEIVPNT